MYGRTILLLIFCFASHGGNESWIEQYATESAAANATCKARDDAACRQHLLSLLQLLDGRADIVYRLAKVESTLGNKGAALDRLTTFSKMGLPFADPGADPAFAPLRESAEFRAILSRLEASRQPVSRSRLFLTLPETDLLTEDIAYDSADDRFYVSSVHHRKILSVKRTGQFTEFLREGQPDQPARKPVWAILALGVDAKHRYLWASTAAMPEALGYSAADRGRSALLKYSLTSHALLKRYDLPRDTEHALGDMTLSAAGDVFVSDGHGPVYWVDHARDELQVLIPRGTFRSPQTPALSPDGSKLFVPDYSRGISSVNLSTKQTQLIPHPKELSLAGIDGLYLVGTTMIAVQNGTSPPRLIRMRLNASLTQIQEWETVESNWPALGTPTHAVVAGSGFYFIANSGWDQFTEDGALKPGAALQSPTIRELSLGSIRYPSASTK